MATLLEKINYNLKPFLHLWKVEDEQWVAQRALDWECLKKSYYHDVSASEVRAGERYFKQGLVIDTMACTVMYLLTPLTDINVAKQFLLSKAIGPKLARDVIFDFYESTEEAKKLSWWSDYHGYLLDIMGREYKRLEAVGNDNSLVTYSPDPSYFCRFFYIRSCCVFAKRKKFNTEEPFVTFQYMDSLDYFCTALRHTVKPTHRRGIDLDNLFQLANTALTRRGLTQEVREFAKKVLVRENEIREMWNINVHMDV